MSTRVTNENLYLIFIVISLVLAGMVAPVMVHAENYKHDVCAREHIESGGRSDEYITDRVNAAGLTDVYYIGFEHGYYNIKANPNIWITVGGVTRRMLARQVDDKEKRELWPHLLSLYPDFDEYQARTDRNIPVFRCSPVG